MKKAATRPEWGTQSDAAFSKTSRRGIRVAIGVGWGGDRNTIPGGTLAIIRTTVGMSTANDS